MAEDQSGTESWPNDFEHIAGNEKSYIAVVHADGNSLGQCLINLQAEHYDFDSSLKLYKAFTDAVTEATERAARAAILTIIDEKKRSYLGRVLVLAGDDLTVVVRADKALEFTKTFLEQFETAAADKLTNAPELPKKLTAAAGIAFVKKSYPFSDAYALAESLCSFSKSAVRDTKPVMPSCLSFCRVTTSSVSQSFEEIIKDELTANEIRLTMMPYKVGEVESIIPRLEDLEEVEQSARELPRGKLRRIYTSLYESAARAVFHYDRLVSFAKEKGADFAAKLEKVTQNNETPILNLGRTACPIHDIVTLAHINRDAESATGNEPTGGTQE